ncbi:MAG: M23 family metallopeptidase [Ignavibacteriales bacterium]|nr:M23 family metallopeptidase [Ignavibacteriales bacterium]
MPADRQHHTSKKLRYNLLLVPSEDAGKSKTIRFAPWQVILLLGGLVALIVTAVLLVLVFTPIGAIVPIQNPELENKYGRELVSLNQRMTTLMEELIELREYNVKLRNALGENAVATDSGVVIVNAPKSSATKETKKEIRTSPTTQAIRNALSQQSTRLSENTVEEKQQVVFPVILPTEGYISRGFEAEQRHYGLDIAGKTGTPVNAAADGHVVFAGWTSDDGYKIIISHAGGFLTFYKHNQSLLKLSNMFIRRGEPIALLGNSGQTSSGPHLHFEIWKDGSPVDPSRYILNLNF